MGGDIMNVRRYFQDGGRRIFNLKSVVVRHNNTWLWKITLRVILFYKVLMPTFKNIPFSETILFLVIRHKQVFSAEQTGNQSGQGDFEMVYLKNNRLQVT